MKKRSNSRLTILLTLAALLSLIGCAPEQTTSTQPMMGDHEAQMPMGADQHEANAEHHDDEAMAEHLEDENMADHHDEMTENGGHMSDHHGDDADSFSSAPPFANAPEIIINADEFSFDPAELNLQAGEEVNIKLVNNGQLPHELTIEGLDFHLHAKAGETITGGLIVPVEGIYEVGCFIAGHYEAGMAGELMVAQ